MSLKEISSTVPSSERHSVGVDIVAVHGLGEEQTEAWTHPESGIFWLRDLLPTARLRARILTFGYQADTSSFFGSASSERILQRAITLVAELQADRDLSNAAERPIIFVCHGLGGILVKRALAYSASQTSKKVEHLYSIFISSYGILFLGTPHNGIENMSWQLMVHATSGAANAPTELQTAMTKNSETLQNITDQFAPLAKRFHIYFFWEGLQTRVGSSTGFVVSEDSAAPIWDNTERSGIHAAYSQMCKFENTESPGYKIVLSAMQRYAREAPNIIEKRWDEARKFLAKQRSDEAAELLGSGTQCNNHPFSYQNEDQTRPKNKHFRIPHSVSAIFTGRNDITQDLQEKILASTAHDAPRQQNRFVCYGLGGSGKTQFCLKFIHDNRDRFWGIFWVDASSVENAERALSEIGQLGGIGETCLAGMYWLTGLEMPWLLVIDNADDPNVDYARFFPAGDRGHILVTSRNPDCRIHATIGYYEFKEMDSEDAITLLLKAAEIKDVTDRENRDRARPMAKALGHLPLALIQAGASIRHNICSLEDYLEIYSSRRSQIISNQPGQGADHYQYTIYTTWEVSFKMIEDQASEVAMDAIHILHIFAFLHFDQVSATIFEKAWNNMQGLNKSEPSQSVAHRLFASFPFSGAFATMFKRSYASNISCDTSELPSLLLLKGARWDRYRVRNALAMLASYSLIFKDTAKESYSMHPMVHFWARDRLAPHDQQKWSGIAAATLALSIATGFMASDQYYRRSLIPHIDSCLHGEHTKPLQDHIAAPDQVSKAFKFAMVYSEGGRWDEARDLQEKVVSARTTRLGPEHLETIKAMGDLGRIYWNLSRLDKALKLQRDVMTISSKTLGDEDPITLKAMDNLGSTYWICGRRIDAETLGKKSMNGMKKVLGPGHPDTLMAMHNYARTLHHCGKPKEAQMIQTEVLRGRAKMLGADHPDTLMTMADLGMSFHALEQLPEAEKLLVNVLEARKRILGQEHAYTLWAINDLSKIFCAQGYAEKAEEMLVNILDIVVRTLGKEHIGMTMTMHNLARAYGGQDRWSDAEAVLVDLVEIQNRKLSPQHPDTLIATAELARVYEHLERPDEAKKLFLKVITIMKEVMGENHPRTLAAVGRLVAIYQAQGQEAEAEELRIEFSTLGAVLPRGRSPKKKNRRSIFASLKMTPDVASKKDEAETQRGRILFRKTV